MKFKQKIATYQRSMSNAVFPHLTCIYRIFTSTKLGRRVGGGRPGKVLNNGNGDSLLFKIH